MSHYPAVGIMKSELRGCRSLKDLFQRVRQITTERGLIYSMPPDEQILILRSKRPKYIPIHVSVQRDRIVYRNVDQEVISVGGVG